MTCIVAVKSPESIVMGADSAGVSGDSLYRRADPKLFTNGEFLIGFTSSFRMGQILRTVPFSFVVIREFKPPTQAEDESSEHFIHTSFIKALRSCLKEHGFTKVENGVEKGGEFIFAYRGELYKVDADFQIAQETSDYMACGCGEAFALGTLRVTNNLPASERVKLALESAAYFSTGVCEPFVIKEIKDK